MKSGQSSERSHLLSSGRTGTVTKWTGFPQGLDSFSDQFITDLAPASSELRSLLLDYLCPVIVVQTVELMVRTCSGDRQLPPSTNAYKACSDLVPSEHKFYYQVHYWIYDIPVAALPLFKISCSAVLTISRTLMNFPMLTFSTLHAQGEHPTGARREISAVAHREVFQSSLPIHQLRDWFWNASFAPWMPQG